jgi:hypothetical protein
MPAAECAMQRNVPTRLIAIAFSKYARSCGFLAPVSRSLPTVFIAGAMPAQLTSTRSCPCAARAFSKPASVLASSVTLTSQNTPPMSFAITSPASALRSNSATLRPLAASARAVAAPRPDAPPVTTAAIEESSCMGVVNPRVTALFARSI